MAITIPDRLREPSFRFVLVKVKDKSPIEKDWQKNANYPYGDPKLSRHLGKDGNYGVLCGVEGLAVIDADSLEVATAVEESLPQTFTVQTGRGGRHFYYRCEDLPGPLRLARPGDAKGTIGDVQSTGKQVIGPGSIHPNGNAYTVLKDLPIASIKAEQIRTALSDFLPPPETDTQEDVTRELPNSSRDVDLDSLKVQDVISMNGLKGQGGKFRGSCPWHGSNTGHNFEVDISKNAWYCFRHGTGGGPLHAIAVQEKVLDCGDCVPGALRGEKFKKVLEIAQDKHGLKTPPQQERGESTEKGQEASKKKKAPRPDLATIMMKMIMQEEESILFRDPIGNPFIQIRRNGHCEIRSLDDSFEHFIATKFSKRTGKAAPSTAVKTALSNLAALAIEEGEVHDLRIRVAHRDQSREVWYDYGDKTWAAIKITKDGWEEVAVPPILFNRTQYTYPQVRPIRGRPEALTELIDRQVNIKNWQKPMIQIQFITDLLAINEQIGSVGKGGSGVGKSSKDKTETALIDPKGEGDANILQNPKRDEDLELYLIQTYIASIDNVSKISEDRSDLLCTATTGGMRSKRAHHKNRQMINDRYRCAVRINGISNPLTREDALNRTIEYTFDQKPLAYKDKGEWWTDYYELLPYALADLFDKTVIALKNYHENRWTGEKPRMGEWFVWAMAAAEAIGMERSDFIALFKRFESERNLTSVENESLAPILMAIADDEDPFIGTATTLLGLKEHEYDLQGPGNGVGPRWIRARAEQAGINWERDKTMPKDPARLGRKLDRLMSILDNVGYDLFKCQARDMLAKCPEYKEKINQYKKEERLIVLRRRSAGTDSIMAGQDSKKGGQQQL